MLFFELLSVWLAKRLTIYLVSSIRQCDWRDAERVLEGEGQHAVMIEVRCFVDRVSCSRSENLMLYDDESHAYRPAEPVRGRLVPACVALMAVWPTPCQSSLLYHAITLFSSETTARDLQCLIQLYLFVTLVALILIWLDWKKIPSILFLSHVLFTNMFKLKLLQTSCDLGGAAVKWFTS